MAGLTASPQLRGQFAAIAGLRWNLFLNSLRSRRGKAELASRIILAIFFFLFGLGGSAGMGAGAYYFVSQNRAEWLALLLWPVFVFWQFFPIAATAFTENVDSSSLLRFPLSYRAYFLVRLAYGLFDPATTVGCLWLMGIVFGVTVADPALFPAVAFILLIFAIVNVLLSRVVFAWVERWLAQRRTREIFGLLLFLFFISIQFIGPLTEKYSRRQSVQIKVAAERFAVLQRALPPGLAAISISSLSQNHFGMGLASLLTLSGYGLIFACLLHLRLRAQYLGENLSEVEAAPRSQQAAEPLRLAWKFPGVSAAVSAISEKELRTLLRSGPMLLSLVMPIVALFVLRVGRWSSAARGLHTPMMRSADFGFPVGSVYALLILTNLVYNNFGADGNGLQFFLASPVRFREIVLGKNLAHAICLLTEVVLVFVVVNIICGPPALAMTVATLAGLLFAAPVNFAAGNLFSLYSPKRVDYGTFGRQKASQTTVLASFGIQLVIFVLGGGTVFLARFYGSLWLAVPIFLLLSAFTIGAYWFVLARVDGIALGHREDMISELGKA